MLRVIDDGRLGLHVNRKSEHNLLSRQRTSARSLLRKGLTVALLQYTRPLRVLKTATCVFKPRRMSIQ